ncbi:hypothetical protein PLESTF_000813600 [Pleodorina starrii]|nr:hypothetical protein PLESTM_001334400 [Pleodorina starrii]GLC69303.1 hypothetical protein PLESTF_000813600 [Pleodorina starrii]
MSECRMELGAALPDLTPQCLSHIFSHLSPHDAARGCCVQKLWRDLIVGDEHLWQRHLAEELGISSKQGADGQSTQTYWEAYTGWRKAFGREYWPYLGRAVRAWTTIKGWLAANMPEILATLRPGLSEAEACAIESELGFALPPALKVLYRLHDGQSLAHDDALERSIRLRRHGAAAAAGGGGSGSGSGAAAAAGGPTGGLEEEHVPLGGGGPVEQDAQVASIFQGLFGGYVVYDHQVVSRMPPLRRAALWRSELVGGMAENSRRIQERLGQTGGREAADQRWRVECERREEEARRAGLEPRASLDHLIPFSCSYNLEEKIFVADAVSGGLALAKPRVGGWDLRQAVPGAGSRDGPLRWFEEYARRLESGYYQPWVLPEQLSVITRIISLFPRTPPAMAEAVTRGVRVRASVVYVPEAVAPRGRHLFAYAIRFSLTEDAPLKRCQLTHRHWVIRDEQGRVLDTVHGEGVIGMYPILEPGQPEFVYCSCTHQVATRGSMEGEFEFVGGTIERPEGGSFAVACPTFRLDMPDYIF